MESNKKNRNSYYISLALLTIATSLPHAILTVILLKKGLSYSNIAFVQSTYSLAIFLFEYPSGVIADIVPKKRLFLFSKIILIVFLGIVFTTNNLLLIILGWVLYGISSALDTGTLDAQIINDLKTNIAEQSKQEIAINRFVKYTNQIGFISLITGSSVGSFLYFKIGLGIYLIAIFLVIISMINILLFYKINYSKVDIHEKFTIQKIKFQVVDSLNELKKSKSLRNIIILSMGAQIFFQTHFQLWQAFFINTGIDKKKFYIFYIAFQIISILAYAIPIKKSRSKNSNIVTLFLPILVFLFGFFSDKKWIIIISYFSFCFFFTFFDYICEFLYMRFVSIDNISSLTSLKSMSSRFASVIVMLITSVLLKYISISIIVPVNFALATLTIIFLLLRFNKSTSEDKKSTYS